MTAEQPWKSMAREARSPREINAAPIVNAPAANAVSCRFVMPSGAASAVPLSH
jgi:hypothetical protein